VYELKVDGGQDPTVLSLADTVAQIIAEDCNEHLKSEEDNHNQTECE